VSGGEAADIIRDYAGTGYTSLNVSSVIPKELHGLDRQFTEGWC
jgi:hypothetical protein